MSWKNPSEERIYNELEILLQGLRDYSIGNSNMVSVSDTENTEKW